MRSRISAGVLTIATALFVGCASQTAFVTDQAETVTRLENVKLEESPALKILLGGAVREIPLKDISELEVDAGESTVFERELYFVAHIRLLESSKYLMFFQKSLDNQTATPLKCFVNIRNTIKGERGSETYRIPLEKVVHLKCEH
jgi:hypothetical protein